MRTLVPLSTVVVDDLDDVIAPSKGDLVTLASDGRLRVWDGSAWQVAAPGATGPTGPTGPAGATGPQPPLSTDTPQPIGTATAGIDTEASPSNHVHAHGNQLGGTLHALATTSLDGFGVQQGAMYFDTDLLLPIFWDGTQWIDAAGVAV